MDIFDLAGRRPEPDRWRRPEPDRWRGTVAEEHSGLYRGLEWRRGAVGGQAAETELHSPQCGGPVPPPSRRHHRGLRGDLQLPQGPQLSLPTGDQ